jgi:Na+/H+ antiporter NhaA
MTELDPSGMSMTSAATSPLRAFLRTEAASAAVLVGAIVVALAWANVSGAGYESFWTTELPIGDFECPGPRWPHRRRVS